MKIALRTMFVLISLLGFGFQIVADASLPKKKPKIVGLIQVRNEAPIIRQCLRALAIYADAIVVLDDASDDGTIALVQSIADQCHVEKIVRNEECAWMKKTESYNRQRLLEAGREIDGTHFIIIDADEMISANCARNNFLRSIILHMNPGDALALRLLHLWQNFAHYRYYFNERQKHFIFCDDGTCHYGNLFLHVPRIPGTLSGGAYLELDTDEYALLHFAYVKWDNVLIKQAWYKCFERVRDAKKPAAEINAWYPCHKEKDAEVFPVRPEWLAYDFFDPSVFNCAQAWYKKQVLEWFATYGRDYFADLDIWHINWDNYSVLR